jgi:protein O-GlcNAc transferase
MGLVRKEPLMSEKPTYEDFVRAMHEYQQVDKLIKQAAQAYASEGLAKAAALYRKVLEIIPHHSECLHRLGLIAHQVGNRNESLTLLEKALEAHPNNAVYNNNLGTVLRQRGDLDRATACFLTAIDLKPDFAEAYNNMGVLYKERGKPEKAISFFQQAVDLKPDFAEALNSLVDQLQSVCAWSQLRDAATRLDILTEKTLAAQTRAAEDPLIGLRRRDDPCHNLAVAKSWSREIAKNMANLGIHFSFDGRNHSGERITIGYLSNNLGDHPVSHQALGLFGAHNRDVFKVHCYSYGRDDRSQYRKEIERRCDSFLDISEISDADAARLIYKDRVDILIDLVGYTRGNRLGICALRPAPIQINYLGFLGTTGADFIDYIITDSVVSPPDHATFYSEKLVYMPHCYQANNRNQPISTQNWKRADFGLPGQGFVFCSFNNAYKIEPIMFDAWMEILQRVPKAVLWLIRESDMAERNLRQEAERRRIKGERLVFAGRLPLDQHLARLRLADLALDTRIYNGGATTSNALWAGVPGITLQGGHFVSRMSSSSLKAVGLPECVTQTIEDYKALAIGLALRPGQLEAMKARLARNRLTWPLFDTNKFCRALEEAFKKMWYIFLAGEIPRRIELSGT